MKRTTVTLALLGVAVIAALSAALGAVAAVRFVGTPLIERSLWFEREMLHAQVDAMRRLNSGSTREAADVLRARSFYAVVLLTSDEEQLQRMKEIPHLYEAAFQVCAGLGTYEIDPVTSGSQKKLAREACAALK